MSQDGDSSERKTRLSSTKQALLEKVLRGKQALQRPKRRITRLVAPGDEQLSFAQERLWFLDQLSPGLPLYTIAMALRLKGDLDRIALECALQQVVERHETLRSYFALKQGQPTVQFLSSEVFQVAFKDMSELSDQSGRRERAQQLMFEEALRPFDLSCGPLLRVYLWRLGVQEHLLLISLHHSIADGWSQQLLLREWFDGYVQQRGAAPLMLPELPMRYSDYTAWQREWLSGEQIKRQIADWQKRLRGAPQILDFPTDYPRPARQSYRGRSVIRHFPSALTARLQLWSQKEGVTLFMLLFTAFGIVLSRYSSQEDLLIGVPIANRQRHEIEGLIGYFTNMLVLRVNLIGMPDSREALRRVKTMLLAAYEQQEVPFEYLMEAMQLERDLSRTPLFQVAFAYQRLERDIREQAWMDLHVEVLDIDTQTAKFDLTLAVDEIGQDLQMRLEYSIDLFTSERMERFLQHWQIILEGMLTHPEWPISHLPLLTSTEEQQLLRASNHDVQVYEATACLHQLFEEQTRRTPSALAAVSQGEKLTYRELDQHANQLAHRLIAQGVGAGSRVGLYLERSIGLVVSMLAILKAGGGYVPLDSAYPRTRLNFICRDAEVAVVITQQYLMEALPEGITQVICLDVEREAIAQESIEPVLHRVEPADLAYIIYTSGSTGQPKGVLIPHQNVVRLFRATEEWFHFNERDVWTLFHSYAFDFSVWEIWGALLYGGKLVIVPYLVSRSPATFYELLQREKVTVLNQTPSAFRQLIQVDVAEQRDLDLRLIIFGGEALDLQCLQPWYARHDDRSPQLVNMYGITETTVHVTYRALRSADLALQAGSVIGVPIADLQLYILDQQRQLVPIGVPGEIYVGGAGLAYGYWNRPKLTQERFVSHPLSLQAEARLYRTGDLARRLPNGDIEYLGRIDQQVKIRGFRIEIGEIEAALRAYSPIQDCLVTVREDLPGDKQLIAYVVASPVAEVTATHLRQHLKTILPEYMLPAQIAFLAEMPLTEHGKIDRRALPALGTSGYVASEWFVAPQTESEEVLAAIWSRVLGVEQVGIDDNFFAIGGDSLRSIQVLALAQQRGQVYSLEQLFQHQTIRALVREVRQADGASEQVEKLGPFDLVKEQDRFYLSPDLEDAYPLTQLQAGMLFHHDYDATLYQNVSTLTIRGQWSQKDWLLALETVVRRHPILRTAFDLTTYSEPLQLVYRQVDVVLRVENLRGLSSQANRLEKSLATEKLQKLVIGQAPLLRFRIYLLNEETFQFVWTEHHAILDGWSVALIVNEILQTYAQLLEKRPHPLNDKGEARRVHMRDFVQLEQSILRVPEAYAYWQKILQAMTNTSIPRWSMARRSMPETAIAAFSLSLGHELSDRIKQLARRATVPSKSVLLAAHLRVLQAVCGQEQLVTGLVCNGRPEGAGGDAVAGLFINTVPFLQELRGGNWLELIQATFANERSLLPYRRYPLARLQREYGNQTLFETVFNFVHFHIYQHVEQMQSLQIIDYQEFQQTNFTLSTTFSLHPFTSDVELHLHYNSQELHKEQIELLMGYYMHVLQAMVERPTSLYRQESVLSDWERERILTTWNATSKSLTDEKTFLQRLAAEVAYHPTATAAICAGQELTYQALNERANRVANYLLAKGVRPESLVGLSVRRSLDLLVGMVGILKAGCAYLPLDPNYPPERLILMLHDAHICWLITQAGISIPAISHPLEAIFLDADWSQIAKQSSENPIIEQSLEHLAYTIYTSGSTGTPKGAMITHGNLVNFFAGMDAYFQEEAEEQGVQREKTWLAVTSTSFDISVLELLWTITRGFTVVIQRDAIEQKKNWQARTPRHKPVEFSLFYFANDEGADSRNKYRLLLESAKYADQHGFAAVWTPERHFHAFGGLYPNPSVMSAGISTITERIQIRAGSVVLPLHHPLRIAEEWSLVDNLSNGRVGISVASGWHPNDFVFAPEQYQRRKEALLEGIETVRRLWRGESISLRNGSGGMTEIQILPRPIQPELPIWMTASGNPETFRLAGELGANLLTHLLGQSVEELSAKIEIYRQARHRYYPDAGEGQVTLMLHTHIGASLDEVRRRVSTPFRRYLSTSLDLLKHLAIGLGWDANVSALPPEDRNVLLDKAFDYYFETSGLFGTPEQCLSLVQRLHACGVDEIGCLIDFGVNEDELLESLPYLDQLRQMSQKVWREIASESVEDVLAVQLQRYTISHLQCTPSLGRILADDPDTLAALRGVRHLLLGGEALPAALVHRLAPVVQGHLYNMYGPTETTIWSAVACVDEIGESVPLGTPIVNTQIYLLDTHGQLVPTGTAGELFIGGLGIVRGYLGRADLTAERFVPDPFATVPGMRLYRTGDVARYRSDGTLEFLGRVDYQVKIRGHRIEIGEIEAVLERHEAVQEAVVIARTDQAGDHSLIGYVVPVDGKPLSTTVLQRYLQSQLPEYMLPSLLMTLESLPLTPNGKVDRLALPDPALALIEMQEEYALPRTPTEELLLNIWKDVLGTRRLSITSNFFTNGGHSLAATQMIARVRKAFRIELSLRSVFEDPTIEGMARRVEAAIQRRCDMSVVLPPIEHITRDPAQPAVLSFAQQRLWFLDRLSPDRALYTQPTALRLQGSVDLATLERVLNEIVRRHAILRTNFVIHHGVPLQLVQPFVPFVLASQRIAREEADRPEELVAEWVRKEAQSSFDLRSGPLFRFAVLKVSAAEHLLMITLHHIITDDWSIGVFVRELVQLYKAFAQGLPSPLAERNLHYSDFARWQRDWLQGEVVEREVAYWREQLAGLSACIELPTDYPRPEIQRFQGSQIPFVLSQELSDGLKLLTQREGVTLFMTLLAAFQLLLSRYSQQVDVAVGTPVANRGYAEIEEMLGCFVNVLALRTQVIGSASFRQLLAHVRETALDAYAHQDVPFEMLVQELRPERNLSHSPFFQVFFIMRNAPVPDLEMGDVQVRPMEIASSQAKFDLTLSVSEEESGLEGYFEYNTALFAAPTIERMLEHWQMVLQAVVACPDQPLASLSLLTPEEQQRQLVLWNRTRQEICFMSVTRRFELQVERTPDEIAVEQGGRSSSYLEMDRRANQLASYLRKQGVRPEVVVGVCLARSIEMIVTILGILKVGGAYLPLDPTIPRGRLQLIVGEAHMALLLTQESYSSNFKGLDAQIIEIDQLWSAVGTESQEPLRGEIVPQQLAYILYTSGSTGTPKGVMVPHQGLSNYLHWCLERYPLLEGCGTPLHSPLTFDLTVTSLFSPLITGRTIVLLPEESGVDALTQALRQERTYSFVKLTPSHLHVLNSSLKPIEVRGKTRSLIIGGEALAREQILFWRTHARETRLINEYGPTETVVGCSMYEIDASQDEELPAYIPIGQPICNTQLYILDQHQQLLPTGAVGELYIAGEGVARGYLQRPDLTAERFLPHPFSTEPGQKMYRTGDLARYRSTGVIEYLGRCDTQVKVRGFRIELGEIESVLRHHPAVHDTTVIVREDTRGNKRLVAYLVSTRHTPVPYAELQQFLAQKLPSYMLPAHYIWLERLPLNTNGKIDRGRLPLPVVQRELEGDQVDLPQTGNELVLATLWQELLGVEAVYRTDNFFALGGHSLLATRLVARIEGALQVRLPLLSIFEYPRLADLAGKITDEQVAQGQTVSTLAGMVLLEKTASTDAQEFLAAVDDLSDEELEALIGGMLTEEESGNE